MQFSDLRNKSTNEFVDITSEEYREYTTSFGKIIRISAPVALSVSASGGHRVLDGAGVSHYVAPGFVEIKWKAKEGQPHFVK